MPRRSLKLRGFQERRWIVKLVGLLVKIRDKALRQGMNKANVAQRLMKLRKCRKTTPGNKRHAIIRKNSWERKNSVRSAERWLILGQHTSRVFFIVYLPGPVGTLAQQVMKKDIKQSIMTGLVVSALEPIAKPRI